MLTTTPTLTELAKAAREAQITLALLTAEQKNAALIAVADALVAHTDEIIAANAVDVDKAEAAGTPAPMIDRLSLSAKRIEGIAEGVRQVAAIPDPVGEVMEKTVRPNGLEISKVRVPMGVIGMIYEARPNVTVDSAALALKAGSAILLRGSSSAETSNEAICRVMRDALAKTDVPADCVTLVAGGGHETVNEMMRLRGYIDVLIPRGGAKLIQNVVLNSTVPVIETGVGNCHIYVDASAKTDDAAKIAVNAKAQRPGVCNAAETILFSRSFPDVAGVCRALADAGVTLHATEWVKTVLDGAGIACVAATEDDFATEYLSLDIAVGDVAGVDEAIAHIRKYTTGHTEAILTEDAAAAEKFLASIDAAAVTCNASTRFTDGFEYGFGAEIGISTQKLHARGPLGLKEICSFKYIVRGNGQIRK